jgi:two-component system, OmpR family, KDP operon response regulator KdpE
LDQEGFSMHNVLGENRTPSLKTTVFMVSDDLESARIWAYSLEQAGLEVCQGGFNDKTLQVWSSEYPDLIILEGNHARMDVFTFCHQMRGEAAVPILLLASENHESYLMAAYQAGADDCIPPPVSPRLFLAKVKAWLRRAQVLPNAALEAIRAGDFGLDPDRRLLSIPSGQVVKLTNLETRLLFLLMNHPAWTLETDYLVDRVWGHFGDGDGILLKNLVYRLRRKIEPNPSQPCYLLTEGSLGYRFRPEGEGSMPAGEAAGSGGASPAGGGLQPALPVDSPGGDYAQDWESAKSAKNRHARNTGQLHRLYPLRRD